MTDIGKYCCFNCPERSFEERRLQDKCPTCGQRYDFPLADCPSEIGGYTVIRALGRGFYGATFVAERRGIVQRKNVLKVVPKAVYQYFGKNFEAECQAHSRAVEGAAYLVRIDDAFHETVKFGDAEIECHVAVLEHLDGDLLQDYLSGKKALSSASVAQIAADLFRMHDELTNRRQNHNDFHAGNIVIERLTKERYRQRAMDPSIRAVAIDFGSLSEDRRSGDTHRSDLHWIAEHIQTLASMLSSGKDELDDLDSRLALSLAMIARSMTPAIENQRIPSSDELVQKIEDEFFRSAEPWRPWRTPLALRNFRESYNAQTLEAWHVPQLLVDPADEWQKMISAPGPLIVTGMRGCGKTMLLRALQFHARAAQRGNESDSYLLNRVRNDGYVGLFVSASSLLTLTDYESLNTDNMFARLAIGYALEAARTLAHLTDLDPSVVREGAARQIQNALASILQGHFSDQEAATIQQLERNLVGHLNQACRLNSPIQIALHPSYAFPLLADAVRQGASIWEGSQVLFLLDDVSTRYLSTDQIEKILSALIFQKPHCAFKLTSETQTIFLSLKSPGGVEPAAHWRDFETFDLGSEVHKRLKRRGGKKFVEDILAQRARFYPAHPHVLPSVVLGDRTLAEIAKIIASSSPNSAARKTVYYGMSALKAVCVGDIGSAITIYENILNRMNRSFPVSPQEQSDIFQDFCSRHLYLLDRRDSRLKNAAKSFAAASYELLMQSAKKKEARGLRQYLSVYVRVTSGDKEEQGKRLRELVDAGVFVFQGGAPRTKTKDSDPIQQFKLAFRKVYGLADFIGLAERDRFELSGVDLEQWLDSPDSGTDILLRNLRTDGDPDDDYDEDVEQPAADGPSTGDVSPRNEEQIGLFETPTLPPDSGPFHQDVKAFELPTIEVIGASSDALKKVDVLCVALGFEERTYVSAQRSMDQLLPSSVLAIRYPEEGRSEQIIQAINSRGIPYSLVDYNDLRSDEFPISGSSVAIDVTGLNKAAIFWMLTGTLKQNSEAVVVYTEAENYYPLEKSLKDLLAARSEKRYHSLLTELKEILSGEQGPYSLESIHSLVSDGTRMKALLAFSSAKHERLIQLVEDYDYDLVKVVVDNSSSARAAVARLAAEVAVRGAAAGSIEECNIKDPNEVLRVIARVFRSSYIDGGLNFELGLTGDKIEAVAAASFCAVINANNVWYVKPKEFDQERFTTGVKATTFYRIKIE